MIRASSRTTNAIRAAELGFAWPTTALQAIASERDLLYHRLVASQLRANPSFLDIARIRMQRWIARNGPRHPYVSWVRLLSRSSDVVSQRLTMRGPAGLQLRAESPLIRAVTDSQQATLLRRFAGTVRYPLDGPCGLTYLRHHLLADAGEALWQLEQPQRKVLDFVLLRCAHSIFVAEEFLVWLVAREPFLLGSTPLDVLVSGDPLRVARVIDAVDQGVYVFSRTIIR
jgi:hypothetical protein